MLCVSELFVPVAISFCEIVFCVRWKGVFVALPCLGRGEGGEDWPCSVCLFDVLFLLADASIKRQN